jgi:hypothetical protein
MVVAIAKPWSTPPQYRRGVDPVGKVIHAIVDNFAPSNIRRRQWLARQPGWTFRFNRFVVAITNARVTPALVAFSMAATLAYIAFLGRPHHDRALRLARDSTD